MGLIIFIIIIAICVRTLLVRANEISLVKYDKRQMKLLKILTIIGLVLAIIGYAQLADLIDINFVFGLISFLFGSGLFFFCSIELIQGALYFKRLKQYGYEIPNNKKEYSNLVECLPKSETKELSNPEWKPANIVMSVLFITGFISFISYNIWLDCFSGYTKTDPIFLGVLILCDLIWLILGLVIVSQANGKRYRDDFEIDENCNKRKVRRPIELWIAVFFILLMFTMIIKYATFSLIKYIFYSRLSQDAETITILSQSIEEVYLESNHTDESKAFYDNLVTGISITESESPEGKLWEEVVVRVNAKQNKSYAVNTINQLAGNIRSSKGPAELSVKIEGNQLVIQLMNPLEKAVFKGGVTISTDFEK